MLCAVVRKGRLMTTRERENERRVMRYTMRWQLSTKLCQNQKPWKGNILGLRLGMLNNTAVGMIY